MTNFNYKLYWSQPIEGPVDSVKKALQYVNRELSVFVPGAAVGCLLGRVVTTFFIPVTPIGLVAGAAFCGLAAVYADRNSQYKVDFFHRSIGGGDDQKRGIQEQCGFVAVQCIMTYLIGYGSSFLPVGNPVALPMALSLSVVQHEAGYSTKETQQYTESAYSFVRQYLWSKEESKTQNPNESAAADVGILPKDGRLFLHQVARRIVATVAFSVLTYPVIKSVIPLSILRYTYNWKHTASVIAVGLVIAKLCIPMPPRDETL